MTLTRLIYTTLLRLATPALLLHFRRRTRRQTGTRDAWRERLGYVAGDARHAIWIHAASAGEMQAALPLAARLSEDWPLRLSAFTASGLARAGAELPSVPATLAPIDMPGAWRRFLDRTNPRLLVLVETELWPNLLAACAARAIPVALVSARLTPANARRMARFRTTTGAMLAQLSAVFTQSEADLARFVELGLPAEKGRVTGNLKTALTVPASVLKQAETLRAGPLAGRKVWVAGSVREGEEAFIAEATARIHADLPEAVTLIVPRHPERAPAFIEALKKQGVDSIGAKVLDSSTQLTPGATLVVDRLGVLLTLYAASDVAFVGGSFAPLGGHNLLEPTVLGLPILAGPHLENVREQAARLTSAGSMTIVQDAAALAREVVSRLGETATTRGAAGEVTRQDGAESQALTATLAALSPWLQNP